MIRCPTPTSPATTTSSAAVTITATTSDASARREFRPAKAGRDLCQVRTIFRAQADQHVDADDLHALRWLRQAAEVDQLLRQVDQHMGLVLSQEMLVGGDVGVEIGPGAVDRDFLQQAGRRELVQRVVDGGERDRRARGLRFLEKPFGGHVTVAAAEQEPAESQALAGRPQACVAKLAPQVMQRAAARGPRRRRGRVNRLAAFCRAVGRPAGARRAFPLLHHDLPLRPFRV